jgi:hypothetical protein
MCSILNCQHVANLEANLEETLILALTKIRPLIKMLACQKQVRTTLIVDKIFNNIILIC